MKKLIFLFFLPAFSGIQCHAQSSSKVYTFKKGDWEGSGKWYMGREIAPVMSHYAIDWLEREEREEEEKVSQLLKNMALKEGEVVADIGAGSGYHVVRMAPMVGNSGKVMAVDIQPEMLVFLQKQADGLKLSNVIPVLGAEKSTGLKPGTVDKVLMVDVYHEFAFPKEMGESIFEALKPGGLVYLIEYRTEDPKVPIKTVHKMSEKQCIKEFEAVGFRFVENMGNLPWQHCLVFIKP